jgi:hypothetical protein
MNIHQTALRRAIDFHTNSLISIWFGILDPMFSIHEFLLGRRRLVRRDAHTDERSAGHLSTSTSPGVLRGTFWRKQSDIHSTRDERRTRVISYCDEGRTLRRHTLLWTSFNVRERA